MYRNLRQFPEFQAMNEKDAKAVLVQFVQKSRPYKLIFGLLLMSFAVIFLAIKFVLPGEALYIRLPVHLLIIAVVYQLPYYYILNRMVRPDFERQLPAIKEELGIA